MDEKQLRELRVKAQIALFHLGEDAFEDKIVVAYDDTGLGFCPSWNWKWKVRAVPKGDVAINIHIGDNGERVLYISFCDEEEVAVRDFILPLLETETYRESVDVCGECRGY